MRYKSDEQMDQIADDYNDNRPSGWCSACHKPATARQMDFGIGPYEYWGCRGFHHDLQWASPCCEAEVLETEPN